jgi:hypothetical protein
MGKLSEKGFIGMVDEYIPTDTEVEAVISAFDTITPYISSRDGTINGSAWRIVYDALGRLSDIELWLGLCNLESAIFEAGAQPSPVHLTLFELFKMVYEQGLEAL